MGHLGGIDAPLWSQVRRRRFPTGSPMQGNRWASKEQQQYDAQQYEAQQQAQQQAQYAPQPPAPAPTAAGGMDAKLAQLNQLGELKQAGVLTDAEFEAQKARVLAG